MLPFAKWHILDQYTHYVIHTQVGNETLINYWVKFGIDVMWLFYEKNNNDNR